MKRYIKYIVFVLIYFMVWAVAVYFIGNKLTESSTKNRVTFMNRMTAQINETGDTNVYDRRAFADDDIADVIEVYYIDDISGAEHFGGENNTYVWTLANPDGTIKGFVKYEYHHDPNLRLIALAEVSFVIALIPLIVLAAVIWLSVLKPFQRFSEYPIKLSKGIATEGIPESRNRLFGKYIWGMNMLNDRLDADRKQIDRLMGSPETLPSPGCH